MANENSKSTNQAAPAGNDSNAGASGAAQPKVAAPKAETPGAEKRYRVLETIDVPHKSGTFCLKKGKVISNKGYHIDHLKRIGAKLEPLEASA